MISDRSPGRAAPGSAPVALPTTIHPDDRRTVERALAEASGHFAVAYRVLAEDGVRREILVGHAAPQVDAVRVDVTEAHFAATTELVSEAVRASDAHRSSIERAKGIVMAEHGVSEAEAFTALRRQSNDANVKLRLLAELVVRERTSVGLVTPAGGRSTDRDERGWHTINITLAPDRDQHAAGRARESLGSR